MKIFRALSRKQQANSKQKKQAHDRKRNTGTGGSPLPWDDLTEALSTSLRPQGDAYNDLFQDGARNWADLFNQIIEASCRQRCSSRIAGHVSERSLQCKLFRVQRFLLIGQFCGGRKSRFRPRERLSAPDAIGRRYDPLTLLLFNRLLAVLADGNILSPAFRTKGRESPPRYIRKRLVSPLPCPAACRYTASVYQRSGPALELMFSGQVEHSTRRCCAYFCHRGEFLRQSGRGNHRRQSSG